ncbi:hypothetical protein JRO89_XS05G0147800 [Xanthoceras sorbifolium]|uniref:CCHC-type domain-containing protein n=1 Tax=Xanthoceras sorbifolium TaxID=99658 RepID=A0ABQ8I1X8_9ROSI|nr:hypothetical protein JRO89_XS05G0147800 [Xanthoceras sorbifolium]
MNRGGNASRRERNAYGHGNVVDGGTVITLEQFKKLGPPAFKGTSDPSVAEAWLKQIEKVFTTIGCPDEQKVTFATFMFQDETVTEYEEQFTSLSRFVTQLIPNDESKGRRFLDGLHPDIQSRVEVLKLGRYADIVDRALIAERSMVECKKAREAYRKINLRRGSSNGNASKQGSQFKKRDNDGHGGSEKAFGDGSLMKNASPCQYCGRSHAGECYRKTRACFGCGKAGHMLKDYPKRRFGPDSATTDKDQKKKSKLQGRVLAIT